MASAWKFDALGGPEQLYLAEEDIASPAPGEATLEFAAIGLNRSDLLWMSGYYIKQPSGTAYLGQEGVGRITALGEGSEASAVGFEPRVGDRAALLAGRVDFEGTGTFRSSGNFPLDALLPVPERLSDEQGASLWLAGLTALGGLWAGGIRQDSAAGRSVVVTAASSGVGVLALQIARAWGARAIAVTTGAHKADALAEHADQVLVTERGADFSAKLVEATDGGFDCAFDPVGYANAASLFQGAGNGGQIVLYGIMAGQQADLDVVALLRKNLGVHGFTIYRLFTEGTLEPAVAELSDLVEQGKVVPVVAETHPLQAAPDALRSMAADQHLGKIVLVP